MEKSDFYFRTQKAVEVLNNACLICSVYLFSAANEWSILHDDDNEENITDPLCSTSDN